MILVFNMQQFENNQSKIAHSLHVDEQIEYANHEHATAAQLFNYFAAADSVNFVKNFIVQSTYGINRIAT